MNTSPNREKILQRFQTGQAVGFALEIGLFVLAIGLLPFIRWQQLQQEWITAVVVALLVPMQFIPGLVQILAINKKDINELNETARFGVFDKHTLRDLVDSVLRDLNIPKKKVRVFVTASKEINAFAVSFGLSRFFPFLRGVYLNRKTLHLTTPQELRSWIGHELGHLFPYALRMDQAAGLQLLAGTIISLIVFQNVGTLGGFGFMIVAGVAWVFLYITSWPRANLSQVCEYLCDEFGAKASGIEAAITDLLKTGAAQEAEFELQMYVLKAAREGRAPSEEAAFRIYESVIGFEPEDVEQTKKRVLAAIQDSKKSSQGLSISGLLDFFWRDPAGSPEAAEQRDQLLALHEQLQKMPFIDWKQITQWNGTSILTAQQIERLVQLLVSSPKAALFRIPGEFQTGEALTHPSFRNRILYLCSGSR